MDEEFEKRIKVIWDRELARRPLLVLCNWLHRRFRLSWRTEKWLRMALYHTFQLPLFWLFVHLAEWNERRLERRIRRLAECNIDPVWLEKFAERMGFEFSEKEDGGVAIAVSKARAKATRYVFGLFSPRQWVEWPPRWRWR